MEGQPSRIEARHAREREVRRLWTIPVSVILGLVAVIIVGIFWTSGFGQEKEAPKPKPQVSRPSAKEQTATPVLATVPLDEAAYPMFVKVEDPTKATWAQVQENANALERSGHKAMWWALYRENADHFVDVAEAKQAVEWERKYEKVNASGRSSALVCVDKDIPAWNTGPSRSNPASYVRGPYTYKPGSYYLKWSERNPYYNKVEDGDGVKANCLNVTTARHPGESAPPKITHRKRVPRCVGAKDVHNRGPWVYNPPAPKNSLAPTYKRDTAEKVEQKRGTGEGSTGQSGNNGEPAPAPPVETPATGETVSGELPRIP